MSDKSTRDNILATLRAGLAAAPLIVPEAPERPEPAPVGPLGPDAWARLAEVLAPLDVQLLLARTPAEAAAHLADIARRREARSYVRWGADLDGLGLDEALAGCERLAPGCCEALARVDLGVVLADACLLDSGSLVLVAGPDRPRAASLLPPASVALVPRRALAPDVAPLPALLERHRRPADADGQPGQVGRLPACLNLVTGPSSTADIELVLVRGVHGPGSLELIGLDWD